LPLQPQRDANGDVVPHDHPEIFSEHGIIRRISDEYLVFDEKCTTGRRISTMAFRASSESNSGMSVDLQHEIENDGLDARTYVTTPRWFGSVRFQAGQLRDEEFMVGADPIETKPGDEMSPGTEPNPYHGEVWGRFTKGKQNRLLQLCEWFVPIPGVSLR
jgi:hypothetical protein